MRLVSLALLFAGSLAAFARGARAGTESKPYDVNGAFAETDVNGDGEIDLSEFHSRMIEVFYSADTDKNGSLSIEEYKRLPFSGDFKDADLAGNGRITLHDFVAVRYRQLIQADRNRDGALSRDEVVAAYEGRTPR